MTFSNLLDKIKDEKLKSLLEQYKEKQNPLLLLMILDYKGIKPNKDRIDAFIVEYQEIVSHGEIELGGLIISGLLYKIAFDIDYQTLRFYHYSEIEVW